MGDQRLLSGLLVVMALADDWMISILGTPAGTLHSEGAAGIRAEERGKLQE